MMHSETMRSIVKGNSKQSFRGFLRGVLASLSLLFFLTSCSVLNYHVRNDVLIKDVFVSNGELAKVELVGKGYWYGVEIGDADNITLLSDYDAQLTVNGTRLEAWSEPNAPRYDYYVLPQTNRVMGFRGGTLHLIERNDSGWEVLKAVPLSGPPLFSRTRRFVTSRLEIGRFAGFEKKDGLSIPRVLPDEEMTVTVYDTTTLEVAYTGKISAEWVTKINRRRCITQEDVLSDHGRYLFFQLSGACRGPRQGDPLEMFVFDLQENQAQVLRSDRKFEIKNILDAEWIGNQFAFLLAPSPGYTGRYDPPSFLFLAGEDAYIDLRLYAGAIPDPIKHPCHLWTHLFWDYPRRRIYAVCVKTTSEAVIGAYGKIVRDNAIVETFDY